MSDGAIAGDGAMLSPAARLRRLAAGSAGRSALGAMLTLAVKLGGTGLAFLMFSLAAHGMGADDFGRLAVWFNAVSLLAVVAVCGQDTLIMRSWGEYVARGRADMGRGAYADGWMLSLGAGVLFGVAVALAGPAIDADASFAVGAAAGVFLLAQTALHYSSHSSRAIAGVAVAEPNRDLVWRLAVAAAMAASVLLGGTASISTFFLVGAAGMAAGILFQSIAVLRRFRAAPAAADVGERPLWRSRAKGMWLSATIEASSQYAEVLVIGALASPAAAGGYFVASRIANAFATISTGLHSYTAGKIATLHYGGDREELDRMLHSVMTVAFLIVTGLCLAVAVFGPFVLGLFGDEYRDEYPTLLLLAFGTALGALGGPTAAILLTTGQEALYPRVITIGFAARLALLCLLVPVWGSFGAALAWTVTQVPLVVVLVVLCRRRTGIDPSALAAVRSHFVRRRAAPAPAPSPSP